MPPEMPYLTLRRKARLGKELPRFLRRIGGDTLLMERKGNWREGHNEYDEREPAHEDSSGP
jgi:hypothetical protein